MRSLCLNNSTNRNRGQEKFSSFSVNRNSRMRDRELTRAAKRMLVSTTTDGFIFSRHFGKRDSLRDHQSDLISSDSFHAWSSVRRLRRAAASTRNQSTKAFTASAGIPSVGMLMRIAFSE